MKLLVWASSFGHTIGGGPLLAPLLCSALAERGHDVLVMTDQRPSTLPAEEVLGAVRVLRFPFRAALTGDSRLFVSLCRRVLDLRRNFLPDLTYIFSPGYGELFHHLTEAGGTVPLVVTLHDSFNRVSFSPEAIVGRDVRAASWVTACSDHVLQNARRHVPAIRERSSVIPNALPSPDRTPPEYFPDHPELLFVGRLVYKKGADVLINAVGRLVGKYPALHLTIVGDGEAEEALKHLVGDVGIARHVTFAGRLDRDMVFARIAASSMLVVPSRIEPFGLVALEAALMGRPVIASRVDGLPEVVIDHDTGRLVPPDNVEALASAIALLIDAPQDCRRLGCRARERARSSFSWDDFVSSFDRLFRGLVRP